MDVRGNWILYTAVPKLIFKDAVWSSTNGIFVIFIEWVTRRRTRSDCRQRTVKFNDISEEQPVDFDLWVHLLMEITHLKCVCKWGRNKKI